MTEEQKQKIEAAAEDKCPVDLHFREECDGSKFRCGAKVSWREGFKAGAAYGIELCESENKMLRDIIIIASEKGTNIHYCSEIARLKNERDLLDRALLMESNSPEERSQEAAHYNWLDDQNEKLNEEIAQLKEKLAVCTEALEKIGKRTPCLCGHFEFCDSCRPNEKIDLARQVLKKIQGGAE